MQYTNNKNPSEQMREVRGYAIISKGDTPAQMAGIGVENNENKWSELLKRS